MSDIMPSTGYLQQDFSLIQWAQGLEAWAHRKTFNFYNSPTRDIRFFGARVERCHSAECFEGNTKRNKLGREGC